MSCFLREQLNHLLVFLLSIPVCLLSRSILVASGLYLTLSGLILICIHLLLRCLLLDMSGSLFSMVIMLSQLISRMLIYVFLLLSNITDFSDLFWHDTPYQWKVLPFGWLQPLGFSQPSLNLSCSFAATRVSVLLSI